MYGQARQIEALGHAQVVRYAINGVFATTLHLGILTFNLQVLDMRSAGVANLCAAAAGISASFLGNRYFVFRLRDEPIFQQVAKFGALYILIAFLHGAVLYGWSDVWNRDYRTGFILATVLQVALSYWGNKLMVFKA